MTKEKPNKWTRERSFLELYGGDLMMLSMALAFLTLMVAGLYVFLAQPHIPGLSEAFSQRPAAIGPPPDQKLHLAPGETEMKLYSDKPRPPPPPPKK